MKKIFAIAWLIMLLFTACTASIIPYGDSVAIVFGDNPVTNWETATPQPTPAPTLEPTPTSTPTNPLDTLTDEQLAILYADTKDPFCYVQTETANINLRSKPSLDGGVYISLEYPAGLEPLGYVHASTATDGIDWWEVEYRDGSKPIRGYMAAFGLFCHDVEQFTGEEG